MIDKKKNHTYLRILTVTISRFWRKAASKFIFKAAEEEEEE